MPFQSHKTVVIFIFFNGFYQQQAQNAAADDLPEPNGDHVEQQNRYAGSFGHENISDFRADNHRIKQDRRKAGEKGNSFEANVAKLIGGDSGQKSGQSSKQHIPGAHAEQVAQKAAQCHRPDGIRRKDRKKRECFTDAHLYRPVGKRLKHKAEHNVNAGNQRGADNSCSSHYSLSASRKTARGRLCGKILALTVPPGRGDGPHKRAEGTKC